MIKKKRMRRKKTLSKISERRRRNVVLLEKSIPRRNTVATVAGRNPEQRSQLKEGEGEKTGKNKKDSTIVIADKIEIIKVQMAAVQIMLIMSAAAGVELCVGGCSPRSKQQLQRQKYL